MDKMGAVLQSCRCFVDHVGSVSVHMYCAHVYICMFMYVFKHASGPTFSCMYVPHRDMKS